MGSLALLVAYLMVMHRIPPKPAPHRGPSLLRVGSFSQYAKSRHTSFRRPGALVPHMRREAAVPQEEALPDAPLETEGPSPSPPLQETPPASEGEQDPQE